MRGLDEGDYVLRSDAVAGDAQVEAPGLVLRR